ncbi:MAG: hypothetical protein RLN96_13180, partial [Pseudomonadales bacterium]
MDDLIIQGGASVSTTSTMAIAGDLTATGTLTASAGTISLSGTGKSIAGAGALQFFALNVPGTITLARDQFISSNLNVAGSLLATAGTTTFNGTTTLSGTASLFNVTLPATRTLTMGTSSHMQIAGAVTSAGTFNTSSNFPNTVTYNGTGAPTLIFSNFYHLIASNGNVKTPSAGTTINGNFTIGAGTTFFGGTFSHSLSGNWANSGTFTPNTSTFTMTGNLDATMSGASTFNNLTINKGTSNNVTLLNNMTTLNLDVSVGKMFTGS